MNDPERIWKLRWQHIVSEYSAGNVHTTKYAEFETKVEGPPRGERVKRETRCPVCSTPISVLATSGAWNRRNRSVWFFVTAAVLIGLVTVLTLLVEPGTSGSTRNNIQALTAFIGLASIAFIIAALVFLGTRFKVMTPGHKLVRWDGPLRKP